MTIAIFFHQERIKAKERAREICQFLKQHGKQVVAEDQDAEPIAALPLSKTDPKTLEAVITLGGDGSILRMVQNHPEIHAPIMAINMGSLGFMADIPEDEIQRALLALLKQEYTVDRRLMIEGLKENSKEHCFALNDIVLHRAANPSLVDLSISVDGLYLNTFSADGLIISTPTGSTAYSLAAGGPIVSPDLKALILTPICPHTISNRPVVLLPKSKIEITCGSPMYPVEVTADGFHTFSISHGESVAVALSKKEFRLFSLPGQDFFSTLRKKLGWSGKLKL